MKKLKLFFSVLMLLLMSVGQIWGEKITLTATSLELTGSYTSETEKTVGGVTFVFTDLMKNSSNIQAKASSGVLYNKTAIPGNITEIKVTHSGTGRSTTVCYGITAQPTTNSETFSGSKTISVSGSNTYFKITRGSNAAYWTSVEITYTPAGTTNPTISTDPVDANYVVNATATALSVTATASSGTLSYQWKSNTTNSTEGASTIQGATNSTYTPSTTSAGTTYYFCVVTDANGSATSGIATVKVTNPTGTFNKLTGNLVEGDYVIYASSKYSYAMKNTITSSRFDAVSVTPVNDKISNPEESLIWHIAPSATEGYWTIYSDGVSKYAGGSATNNQATLLNDASTDYSLWSISITDGVASISNKGRGSDRNLLKLNSDNNKWGLFTSGNVSPTLYKKALPTHEVTFTASPTGGTVAVSVGGSAISSGAKVEEGATVTISPTASTYYRIASVKKGDQTITPVSNVYSFVMPTSDITITITFELIPVTAITLNKTELKLVEGATEALSVSSVTPNTARATVTWSSTDTKVATVSDAGVVTAVKEGTATIKATSTVSTSVYGSCDVTVSAPSGNPVSITQTTGGMVTANVDVADVQAGTSVTLTATPIDGYSFNSWTVLDENADDITPTAQSGNTFTFDMPNSEVLAEASFTHEVAVLKLHDANGESTFDSEHTHYWKESVTLPDNAAACSKTFMGWSTDENRATAPEIAKGASYTIPNKGTNHLYAVYAKAEGGNTTAVLNVASYAQANSWVNSQAYSGFTINGVTFTANGGGNNGKYYSSDDSWRFYNGGSMSISALANILSVTSTPSKTFTINGTSASVSLSATTQFTSVIVTVAGEPTYSNYSTSCLQQLAKPTFGVEAGSYTTAQSITLSATNSADIYYSLDGTKPTTSSTKYTTAISLSERGETTIKAIAVKQGYETSDVAEAKYNINLPFTVAEAIALIPNNNDERANTYIDGIVCTAATSISSGAMTYYISDDGSETSRIRIYSGKGLNNENFNAATDLKEGDKVRVYGKLNNYQGSYAVDNSYLTSLVVATLDEVEISGTAAKTAYSAEDNTFSYAGLTATATYNTGYKKDVTASATWKANGSASYTVTEGGNVSVTATFGGKTSDAEVVTVTYTTKTVKSISLSYNATTVYKGADCPEPVVTASYVEDIADEDVSDLATFDKSAYKADELDTYTINVSYQGKNASYTVTVKAIANDRATAYTAAEINDIIVNAYKSTSESSYDVYVRGIVVSDPNNSGTYYISADGTSENQFTIWQGKYFSSSESAKGNVKANDDVIVKGKIQYYNSTTPELKSSTVVSQLREVALTVADVAEFEVGTADLAEADLTINRNGSDGAITFVSSNTNALTIVNNKLHAVEAADVEVTATMAATANVGALNYKAKETAFIVHVIAARTRYAVTFNNGGATGGTAPEAIANQLEGTEITLPECTWSWAQHGFDKWEVTNNSTSAKIDIVNNKFTMPASAVTITAKWNEIATTHVVFSVNGNTSLVAAEDVQQEAEYTIPNSKTTDSQSGYDFVGWAESEQTDDVETPITTITKFTPAAEQAEKVLYAVFSRTVTGSNKTDVLTAADLAATGTSYVEFSNVQKNSVAKYAGKTAKNGENIQINDASGQCIMSTVSGGVIKNVSITWGGSSNTLDVYASNTAYTAIGDLWDNSKRGTKVTSFTASGSYNFSSDYAYVGVRSSKNAIQLASVSITWQPKTTYYTTNPAVVYDVTYNLGTNPDGAWKANEGCDDAKVKSGLTYNICEDEPVREHHKFNGWTIGGNAASGTITITGNTEITANWIAKVENNITYNAGTGTGSDAVVANQEEGAEITLPSAADKSLSKSGYNFVGWLYDGELYKAGTTFEMPASAVTFVAQWKKQNTEKYVLVTDASQLANGAKIVLANQTASAVAGASSAESDTYLAKETGTFNEDKSELTDLGDGIALTLVQVTDGWALEYNGKYLKPHSSNKVAWAATQTVWTISISENDAIIETPGNSGSVLRYNKNAGNERFSAYTSKTACEPIQLYTNMTAIANTTTTEELGYVDGDVLVVNEGGTLTVNTPSKPKVLVVKDGATVNITAQTNTDNLSIDNGGIVDVTDGTLATNDFVIGATEGKSGQLIGTNVAATSLSIEIKLIDGDMNAEASRKWYCISAPFDVSINNGFLWGNGTPMVHNVDFQIFEYDGNKRANSGNGWQRVSGTMKAGVAYYIGFDDERTNQNVIRLKATNTAIPTATSIALGTYNSSESGNANWNGVANPTLHYIGINKQVQAYNNNTHRFEPFDVDGNGKSKDNFVVGTPFFVQDNTSIVLDDDDRGSGHYRAPKLASEKFSYCVRISKPGATRHDDKMYVNAMETATSTYEQGHDMVSFNGTTSTDGALLWTENYGKRLAIQEAPLYNNNATFEMMLSAPRAGDYVLTVDDEYDNASLYLTYNGSIIWDLSASPFSITLNQGVNYGYGLLMQVNAPHVATGVDNLQSDKQVQKVIINEHVFIFRDGQLYDITGKIAK